MIQLTALISLVKNYKYVIGAITIASTSIYISSIYYNYKIDKIEQMHYNYIKETDKEFLKQKVSILEQNSKIKDENEKLSLKLKGIEDEKYKLHNELQESNSRLKSAISTNERRLYINAKCTPSTSDSSGKNTGSTTSSLDDGKTSKAIIDSRDATDIISITEKADKYKSQLEALQEWIIELNNPE